MLAAILYFATRSKNIGIKAAADEAILLRTTAKNLPDALQAKVEELHYILREYENQLKG